MSFWTPYPKELSKPLTFGGLSELWAASKKTLSQKPKSSTEVELNEQVFQRLEEKLFLKSVLTFANTAFPSGPVIEWGWRYLFVSWSVAESPPPSHQNVMSMQRKGV